MRQKSSRVRIKAGRSLTNCLQGQNSLSLQKNNLLSIKVELDGEKQRLNNLPLPFFLRLSFVPLLLPPPPAHASIESGMGNHRMVGGDLKDLLVPIPCCVEGCHPQDQAAQGPIQPDLECFQGWSTQSFFGQHVPVVFSLYFTLV